ncbi:SigE family RNA polymerase sigma factor [Kineococcus sp. SYSU DK001]|uniref:SigE family RNA polymerase sigma factor n=1 Tax=Kineococcus sp. SYSU DK001 TaxID=3383122 RepID=UPI003D7EEDAB
MITFEDFVAARGAALQRLARGLLPPADAEAAVQDVLARASLRWGRLGRAGDPTPLVQRMLVEAGTSWRWRVRRAAPSPGADGGVLARLRSLPAPQRAVLALRYLGDDLGDLDDERVADVLDRTPAAVRRDAGRGLAALHREPATGAPSRTA